MKTKLYAAPGDRSMFLAAEQNRKMAASAHAYVRGSTKRFYEWLESSNRPELPEGPPVWICGDCHVGNLGPVASKDAPLCHASKAVDHRGTRTPFCDCAPQYVIIPHGGIVRQTSYVSARSS
jgi:hypothetical protein